MMKQSLSEVVLRLLLKFTWLLLIFLFDCASPEREEKEDQFSLHIRTSEPRTPEEERLGFKLPDGFEIELFASEPDIGKPMNISFDPKGRLWVTQSNEYPFYDSAGTGPDRISILEDTDRDGRADKIKVFADSLNIPIGITPMIDGAIAYSIPYVYHLIDHDHDDQVDERKVLLKGFEYKDTHGMINNFFRGLDGWIHADHGFSNVSHVVGTDNKEPLVMQSGNTFRFHPDGTGVEFTTTGRVNPFGYAMDEYGYMYSVDCHSSPIYQLIRGADYPHFGKQPTGIGFGPYMMRHEYGSTALAGLEYYTGDQFPEEFRQNFYLGDVVKCRVYRSSIEMQGTTPVPTWEPDFIISDDPWFRPVDVKLGPDGALYIADFYNSIIGHYEVPLDHPARDKRRGRIWRVTYKESRDDHISKDWTVEDLDGLIGGIKDPAINIRLMVADQIVDRFGKDAIDPVKQLVGQLKVDDRSFIHGMWILSRLEALEENLLVKGLDHANDQVRVHMLRILFEQPDISEEMLSLARAMLEENNPHVTRAVTMLLAKHPTEDQVTTFLELKSRTSEDDTHLYYAIRQNLRDHLRNENILRAVSQKTWDEKDSRALADVLMGVDNHLAAQFMHAHLKAYEEPKDFFLKYTTHIARFLPAMEMNDFVHTLKSVAGGDPDLEYQTFLSLQKGMDQGGKEVSGEARKWAISLAEIFLADIPGSKAWSTTPLSNNYNANPWVFETFEEVADEQILISGPRRGRNGAINKFISPVFDLPEKINFTLVGHKAPPDEEGNTGPVTNRVELFLTGQKAPILSKDITGPDQVEEITWDAGDHFGKSGFMVITDGSPGWGEYIGIGKPGMGLPTLPSQSPGQQTERLIFASKAAGNLNATSLESRLQQLLEAENADVLARTAAAEALVNQSAENVTFIGPVIRDFDESEVLRRRLVTILGELQTSRSITILASVLDTLSFDLQKDAVLMMSNHSEGIETVLGAAKELDISPKLLLDPQISQRLEENMTASQRTAYASLTENLSPFSEEAQKLIENRVRNFATEDVSLTVGETIFQQNCAICHEIGGQGGNIGPQLDGIGNWGLQALSEKILDPNRNISKAFVNYKIELKDGRVAQGLYRRDEGKIKVFADVSGNEFTYSTDEIKSMNALPFTLMPDNFSKVISEGDYYHLMGYLLNQN